MLEDIAERSMRRVMESVNTKIRTEVNNLRKEIDELRRSLELIVETAVANVRKMLEDRVPPVESKVRDLEESVAILRDQVSANQDAIKSISLSKLDHDSLLEEIKSIRTLANNSMIHSNDNEQYSRRNNLRFRGLKCCDGTNTVDMVLNFLHSDLGLSDVTSNDIIAAHPLPMANKTVFDPDSNKSRNQTSQVPTMLVKFRNRMVKEASFVREAF